MADYYTSNNTYPTGNNTNFNNTCKVLAEEEEQIRENEISIENEQTSKEPPNSNCLDPIPVFKREEFVIHSPKIFSESDVEEKSKDPISNTLEEVDKTSLLVDSKVTG